MSGRLRAWARRVKRELAALAVAARDRRTPWYARLVVLCVVGYALSPIDLVPDPIPLLGYLDDLILLPLGISLAIKLVPPAVMREARLRADESERSPSRVAAVAIVAIWIALTLATSIWVRSAIG